MDHRAIESSVLSYLSFIYLFFFELFLRFSLFSLIRRLVTLIFNLLYLIRSSIFPEVRGIPFNEEDEGDAIVPIKGMKSSWAADFCYETKEIFLVDSALEKLFSVKTDGTEFKTLIDTGLENPQGLAVDWIAKNLYIVDAGRDLIEVRTLVIFTYLQAMNRFY